MCLRNKQKCVSKNEQGVFVCSRTPAVRVSLRDNNCYITFILTSWATSNLLNVCSFCICAAVGGKDDVVKKEDAQKDQVNWPWKKVGASSLLCV